MPSKIQFNRHLPIMDTELPLKAGRETYFRTFGYLLQNVSTSAWLPTPYVVMPFWPSDTELNLGPVVNRTEQKWRAETLVFKNEFECTPFKVSKRVPNVTVEEDGVNTFVFHYLTLGMESSDGCKYDLEINSHWFNMVENGGAQWTSLDALFLSSDTMKKITANNSGVGYDDPSGVYFDYFKVNISKECDNRELLLATSPIWDAPDYDPDSNVTVPATIYTNHTMQSYLCASTPYMARIPVTISLFPSNSVAEVDDGEFRKLRQPVPRSFLNHSRLQEQYFHTNWTKYMSQSQVFSDGELIGPPSVLGAWYKFNTTVMSKAADLPERAAQIRHRFLGELLMSSFTNEETIEQENILGELTIPRRRVIVVTEAAIALASLFCTSFAILGFLFFLSRPTRRPLQLLQNPWPTVGAAALISTGSLSKSPGHLAAVTSTESEADLIGTKYSLRHGTLDELDLSPQDGKAASMASPQSKKSDRRPPVTRLRVMLSLLFYLLILAVALAILYHFARKSLLYQTAFVYQTDLSFFNNHMSTIAPYSIVPTVFAVCVGLWWDALDKSLRDMQPYLTMSQRSTRLSDGVCVSYKSSYWMWASVKAAKHKHWTLVAITFGSTLCQVLIVSMSALFERSSGQMINAMPIERTLELQQVPRSQPLANGYSAGTTGATPVLNKLFENIDTSWMYTAAIQLLLDGAEPAWSRNGWSFVPVDISHIERPAIQKTGQIDDEDGYASSPNDIANGLPMFSSMNVTLHTPAIRARVECSPVDTVGNLSAWFATVNLTDEYDWNVTTNPQDWKPGWWAKRVGGGNISTSLFAHPTRLNCCGNMTGDDDMVAIGYWSTPNSYAQPHSFEPWPVNITSKWLYGRGRDIYQRNRNMSASEAYTAEEMMATYLVFRDPPKLQMLTCAPTIESAEAEVTVDRETRDIVSYTISDKKPQWEIQAWTDPFVIHNSSEICRERFPNTNWTDPIKAAETNCSFENVTTR
jgi:hypothetical protein